MKLIDKIAKLFRKPEQNLYQNPHFVVYKTLLPERYKISTTINATDVNLLQDKPKLLKNHIEDMILQELRPLIWDNLKCERDYCSNEYKYSLNFWIESPEGKDK